MFQATTIGRAELDVGKLADALVYYGRTNLAVNGGALAALTAALKYENVVSALELGVLDLSYEQAQYGVKTQTIGTLPHHTFEGFSLAASSAGKKVLSPSDEIEIQLIRRFGKSKYIKAQADYLASKIIPREISERALEATKFDLKDQAFLPEAMKACLQALVPACPLPDQVKFEAATTRDGYVVLSNLDYRKINEQFHRFVSPTQSTVTPALLLSYLLTATKELVLSANSGTDLWLDAPSAAILQTRVNSVAKRAAQTQNDINYFHLVELENRTFRDVINSGERSGADLIALLQDPETIKFKTWLSTQPDQAHLLKEYTKAVAARHSWTERLPFRASKVAIFAGLGLGVDVLLGTMGAATAAGSLAGGVALGATDEFLVPKLIKGWRPDQFVDGPAKAFLAPNVSDLSRRRA